MGGLGGGAPGAPGVGGTAQAYKLIHIFLLQIKVKLIHVPPLYISIYPATCPHNAPEPH